MINSLRQKDQGTCRHDGMLDVRTTGLYRRVCEACGTVSFVFESDLDSEVGRDRFSRDADELIGAVRS